MHEILWVMAGTFIAACIGGMTNFLAIKMLFHPRTAVFLGNAKLPFTPGLIPKRKAEIARSLGKVVGDYLVTSRGLVSVLRQETFRKKWEEKLIRAVSERLDSERTVRETLVHYTGRQRGNNWSAP